MKFNALNGGNKMKINFKKPEDIYKVGNVIKAYETLGILGEAFSNEDDTLVEAEINVL